VAQEYYLPTKREQVTIENCKDKNPICSIAEGGEP
jgi:hypothetical protein